MGSLDEDVKNQLEQVEENLEKMDNFFGNLEEVDYETVTSNMPPLDRAKYDITISYALNSLFWMYLRSVGDDPNNHKIKEELDRIKGQMQKLKQISDKAKRPKVNTAAAGRMIRHGINLQNQSRKRKTEEDENWENEQTEDATSSSAAGPSGT